MLMIVTFVPAASASLMRIAASTAIASNWLVTGATPCGGTTFFAASSTLKLDGRDVPVRDLLHADNDMQLRPSLGQNRVLQ